ncbi:hypothetical protein [Halalkalicoccus subterraneus]|nr:hypothetical protein [Halalkalicoccus subterraneus]
MAVLADLEKEDVELKKRRGKKFVVVDSEGTGRKPEAPRPSEFDAVARP